jgi:hypothetical protein
MTTENIVQISAAIFGFWMMFIVPYDIRVSLEIWNWSINTNDVKARNIVIIWLVPVIAAIYFGRKLNVHYMGSGNSGGGGTDGTDSGC